MQLHLRDVTLEDAPAVGRLLGHLGYAASAGDARARLAQLLGEAHRVVRGAALDGELVGLAVGEVGLTLTRDGLVARLALLVVDEARQGSGIGTALLRDFEEWARARGAGSAHLVSATRRAAAHAFYARRGWSVTGVRMGRSLD